MLPYPIACPNGTNTSQPHKNYGPNPCTNPEAGGPELMVNKLTLEVGWHRYTSVCNASANTRRHRKGFHVRPDWATRLKSFALVTSAACLRKVDTRFSGYAACNVGVNNSDPFGGPCETGTYCCACTGGGSFPPQKVRCKALCN